MSDLISRQAIMKEFADFVRRSNNSDFAPTPTWNDAVSLVGSMPSVQPELCEDANKLKRCRFEYINACKIVAHPTPDTSKNDIYDAYAVMKALYPIFGDEECEEPSAQPERKQGKWISFGKVCNCSVCHKGYDHTYEFIEEWNYCPNCGADMSGEQE